MRSRYCPGREHKNAPQEMHGQPGSFAESLRKIRLCRPQRLLFRNNYKTPRICYLRSRYVGLFARNHVNRSSSLFRP